MTRFALWLILVVAIFHGTTDAQSNYVYESKSASYFCSSSSTGICPVTLQNRRCADNWIGCKCDMPVCTPPCKGDQVCSKDHTCVCLKTGKGTGTNCPYAPCAGGDDCYPGTCGDDGTNCTCPVQSGFSGKNCINITAVPAINRCTIQIYNGAVALIKAVPCAASNFDSSTTWINTNTISKIESIWTAVYENGVALPDITIANYMLAVPVIGVTKAGVDVEFSTNSSQSVPNSKSCDKAVEGPNPPIATSVDCDVSTTWNDIGLGSQLPQHNQMFKVTVWAQLGGQKQVKGSTLVQKFNGTKTSRIAFFRFDLLGPSHCLMVNTKDQCPYFPIYLDQDIRTNPTIQLQFYNWTDDGSGIASYSVSIYELQLAGGTLLTNIGDPLPGSTQTVTPGTTSTYFYTMTRAGVYSIELTVSDGAGNLAKARKIFIYNPSNSLTTNPDAPIYLNQANSKSNVTWLTSFDDSRDGSYIPLTVTWTNHFKSSAGYSNTGNYGTAVQQWPSNPNLIDDKFGQRYGRRSIEAISSLTNGISSYAISYTVDQNGGGRGLSPQNWIPLNSTVTSYNLPINNSLPDGTTIVVWIQATDASFSSVVEKLTIGVDRSSPEVSAQWKQLKTGEFKSNTTVGFTVSDTSSGISQITYRIFISGNPLEVKTVGPSKRPPPSPGSRSKRDLITACNPTDNTCYCIPQGDCYDKNQTITIDNCDIDRYAGQYFVIRYTVTNLANATSIEQSLELGFLSSNDIPCRPPTPACNGGCIAGIVIGIIVLILLILILILLLWIFYFKRPVPQRISNLGKTFRRREVKSYEDENAAYETTGAFSNISKKVSVFMGKGKKVDDDEYIYTGSEAIRNNSTHIQRKNLQMDSLISNEGRFAVIKKAYLQDGNERKTVAVKALRSGFSGADVKLMEEKIQFLSGVPRHANIVNFLGASEEENNGGPIMILEYCGIPLKDWLKQQQKVTSEVLESMLTFTLNIARGVEHLHDNEIIHRRLAVRNVLLTQQFGGWVAKLIGFGPNREDSGDGAKKAAVPVKWLSPETLSTINTADPTYTKKTDVWSFGITAWEIYSLGDAPYPGKSSSDAKKLIIKGLKPTKPNECPEDLYQTAIQPCWETNPNNRPDMSRICSAIDNFHKGASDGQQGYYTAGDSNYTDQAYGGGGGKREPGLEIYDDGQ